VHIISSLIYAKYLKEKNDKRITKEDVYKRMIQSASFKGCTPYFEGKENMEERGKNGMFYISQKDIIHGYNSFNYSTSKEKLDACLRVILPSLS
jgi:hypothetical protein